MFLRRNAFRIFVLSATIVLSGVFACSGAPNNHKVLLQGYVYDGATGARLTGYQIVATYGDETINGTVNSSGMYTIDAIRTWQDYSIQITASGYRSFRSSNSGFDVPAALSGTPDVAKSASSQTYFFDAYVFPSNLSTPAVTVSIKKADKPDEPPSGKIRFAPSGQSSIIPSRADVSTQLWANDEDLQGNVIVKDFTDGMLTLDAGTLQYGVQYTVTIYNVEGYAPQASTFDAGSATYAQFTLNPLATEPLALVSQNSSACVPPTDLVTSANTATITLEFNKDIELVSAPTAAETIDSGFGIYAPNMGMGTSQLNPNTSSSTQERGTTVQVAGKTLTLSWNPATGLASHNSTIECLAYRSLNQVSVQEVGNATTATSISELITALDASYVSPSKLYCKASATASCGSL